MVTTSDGESAAAVSGVRREVVYVKQAEKELKQMFGSVPKWRATQVATCISYLADGVEPNLEIRQLALSKGLKAWEIKLNGSPALRVVFTTKVTGKLIILYAGKKTAQGTDQEMIRTVEARLKAL